MQKAVVLLFIYILSTVGCLGSTVDSNQKLSYSDKIIFNETMEVCRKSNGYIRAVLNQNTMKAMMISMGELFAMIVPGFTSEEETKKYFTKQALLSDYTYDRLHSPGFVLALHTCYPNQQDLQETFVISMMVADTIGKAPGIVALMYLFKGSKTISAKALKTFPIASKVLMWGGATSGLAFAILESKKQIEDRELTPAEEKRLEHITSGFKQTRQELDSILLQIADEEISRLEEQYQNTSLDEEKQNIQYHIQNIKEKMESLKKG